MMVHAYFENIQPKIAKELNKAQRSILVAVAWFTDKMLYEILCEKASQGINVAVLLLNDGINAIYGIEPEILRNAGGEINLIGSKDEMMHNKFCVIDQETVITGSYNWTQRAQSNDENITISKGSRELATDFIQEFQRLHKKYLSQSIHIEIDLVIVVKRLEILNRTIALGDEEDINYQCDKLQKSYAIGEFPDDLKDIKILIEIIKQGRYGEAARLITVILDRFMAVVVWTDPEISGLKLEIHALELQISSLEDEKSDIEKHIFDFEVRHNKELGELIMQILTLRRQLAECEAKEHPEDEKKQHEFERSRQEHDEYEETIEKTRDVHHHDLTEEQQEDINKKFRMISKLAHPDLVDSRFAEQAADIFIRAKRARDANDLETINEIWEFLEKGKPFPLKHETITEKAMIKAEVARLNLITKNILREINILKNSETYKIISGIQNLTAYFDEKREKLQAELTCLTELCNNE